MNPRVSVPKIFIRGSRWYVRVQVAKSMQKRLKRKEYWVSLNTSEKSEALQRATAKTQEKRREINAVYRRLEEIRETITELTEEQVTALMREEYSLNRIDPDALIVEQQSSGLSWDDFVDKIASRNKAIVASLRAEGYNNPALRIRAHRLMQENGVTCPRSSRAYQQVEVVPFFGTGLQRF
jgi:hypothetical protein